MSFITEYAWLKGYAKGKGFTNLQHGIYLAEKLHDGQKRKSGEPYLVHPVRVTCGLASLGIEDDIILATAILHDVIEDCGVTKDGLVRMYNADLQVASNVNLLSRQIGVSDDVYFGRMENNADCILVKIGDNCNNMSNMSTVFTKEKMLSKVEETLKYIIPLGKYGRRLYPQYTDQFYYMKYHLESICDTIKGLLDVKEVKNG